MKKSFFDPVDVTNYIADDAFIKEDAYSVVAPPPVPFGVSAELVQISLLLIPAVLRLFLIIICGIISKLPNIELIVQRILLTNYYKCL